MKVDVILEYTEEDYNDFKADWEEWVDNPSIDAEQYSFDIFKIQLVEFFLEHPEDWINENNIIIRKELYT